MPNRFFRWLALPLLTTLLVLFAPDKTPAQSDSLVFSEPLSGKQNISNHLAVWQDTIGNYHIEDLIGDTLIGFSAYSDSNFVLKFPITTWLKIKLTNNGDFDIPAAFTFCHLADSIDLYAVKNNVVSYRASTGSAYIPALKPVPSANNNLVVYLPAQETQFFYVRVVFSEPVTPKHLGELHIKNPTEMTSELIFKYTGQAFYAGLMLMFALLSFFGWLLIRDRSFLYFSSVHLAFTFYFLAVKNVFSVLVFNVPEFSVFNLQDISISLLIISLFVFITRYLKMNKRKPKAYQAVLIITVVVALNKYILNMFSENQFLLVIVSNALIFIWLIAIVWPIVSLARKRIPEAVNLLISLAILVITAAVYLFAISRIIPQNFVTIHSIQIGSILFALLVFYHLFEAVRRIENEKQRALTISDLKSKFFTNVSHEFRTPLTLILSPLEKLAETVKGRSEKKYVQLADKHANRLLHLINQLLDIARLEEGEVKLSVQKVNIIPFSKGILMSFESLADDNKIALNFDSTHTETSLWLDTEKLEVILYNLISNAIKHTSAHGKVSIKVIEHTERVQIQVKDTGAGIPSDVLPYVFDRFFRVENTGADGNGVGLCLANELTQLHHGDLCVESTVGVGSLFTLAFKKGNAHFVQSKTVEVVKKKEVTGVYTGTVLTPANGDTLLEKSDSAVFPSTASGTRPSVLLVEDNADVRAFIRSQLIDRFVVQEAVNGRVGFDMAVEHMPELIISDVMMPVMDGVDLCKMIKSDGRTSHIPVILLTAKSEQTHRLEGLEAGADDYLPKPFNVKELNLRIQKLIELRINLRQRLLEAPTLSFTPLNGSPVENQIIEQITTCIHEHLSDPQFSVSVLAESVKLSGQQLNKKLRAITGLTANKYIQSVRLKKALMMLETEDLNVSEVAFKTGFGSTAYFVKTFREQFGKTPGSVLRSE